MKRRWAILRWVCTLGLPLALVAQLFELWFNFWSTYERPALPAPFRFAIPMWLLAIAFGIAALMLWWPSMCAYRDRQAWLRGLIANRCPKCGYSLSGLAPGLPCPECGSRGG